MGRGLTATAVLMLAASVLLAGGMVAQALERLAGGLTVHLVEPTEQQEEAPPLVLRL